MLLFTTDRSSDNKVSGQDISSDENLLQNYLDLEFSY